MRRLAILCFLILGGCSLGEQFLVPNPTWVGEPSAVGLAYEDVELPIGDDAVHGWFVPSAASDGRTVVLCHGNGANISLYHPYYRFLHDAGFHVFLFDYRGYGRSRGELSVDALFTDTEAALRYVFARPDVDGGKVLLFGMSLGAIVALHAAAEHPEVAGIVIEAASSPHALLQREAGGFLTFWAELLSLPGGLEPADNAARYHGPALFLCGERDRQLPEHLAAAAAHAGPTASWVMADTSHPPAGLLMHEVDYERTITRYLHACADGHAPRLEVAVGPAADGQVPVTVTRHDLGGEPLAVELTLVDDAEHVRFERFWLRGAAVTRSLASAQPLRFTAAWPCSAVDGTAGVDGWQPRPGPLRRAYEVLPILRSVVAIMVEGDRPLVDARSFVTTLAWQENEYGPLPPLAVTELIPALVAVGRELAASAEPADRADARRLLQRAIAAEPADPRLHYWPDSPYVVGFAHGAEVAAARELLRRLDG